MHPFNNHVLPITVTEVPGHFSLSVGIDHTNPKQYAVVAVMGYGSPVINVCHYQQGHWVPFYPLTERGTVERVANVKIGTDVSAFLAHLNDGAVASVLNASLVQSGDHTRLVSTLGGSPTVVTINAALGSVVAYYHGYAVWLMHNGRVNQAIQMGPQEITELTTLMNSTGGGVNQGYGQPLQQQNYGYGGFMHNPRPQGAQPYGGAMYGQPQYGQPHNFGQPAGPIDEGNYRSAGPRNNAYSSPETLIRNVDVIRLKTGEFAAPDQNEGDAISGLKLEIHYTSNDNMRRITLPVGESQTIVGYISLRDGKVDGVMSAGTYVFTSELCSVFAAGEAGQVHASIDYQQTSMGYDINVVTGNDVISVRVEQKPALTLTDALYAVICNWYGVSSGDKPVTEEQYAILAPAILEELANLGCDDMVQSRTDTIEGIKYTVHMFDGIKQVSVEVTDLSLPANAKFKAVVKLVCVDLEPTAYVDMKEIVDLL
ncbi:hypothetical protein pEaSNUABM54_00228 [Erwinia phage pEa_SNUABM_54]|nr:hypothetical protein pEaSNUABM54_00228 [Erwinia phage pEa_SNUABM_54]